jgi:hypothetical protein
LVEDNFDCIEHVPAIVGIPPTQISKQTGMLGDVIVRICLISEFFPIRLAKRGFNSTFEGEDKRCAAGCLREVECWPRRMVPLHLRSSDGAYR